MCGGGGGGDGGAAQREAERQRLINEGYSNITNAFTGFNDEFYSGREKSYLDFALPQLDDQYEKAKQDLIFTLARNNRLDSSTRGEQLADLQKQYDLQRTNLSDKALGYATSARGDVERARSDLVAQNSSLQNPAATNDIATTRAVALSQQPEFDPLGSIFQNVGAGLATASTANQKRKEMQQLSNLFLINNSGQGSARTVEG